MSITNLEKIFGDNLLVYCNLNNEIIIECICLSKLYPLNNNKKIVFFTCDKVKIITIYDIYKNIIFKPIQIDLFKDPIKIDRILENLKEKNIYLFKTFLEAFLIKNKLNGIKYVTNYNINYNINYSNTSRFLYNFTYDNINIDLYDFGKSCNIFNNKNDIIYKIYFDCNIHIDCYVNKEYIISYIIYNNHNKIFISDYIYIYLNKKNLKVFRIENHHYFRYIYEENRNCNNEIIMLKEKNDIGEIKEEFVSNNINPPFSKPLKKYYIEIINNYDKHMNYLIKIFKYILKKTNVIHYNLLLNYNLEMIDF